MKLGDHLTLTPSYYAYDNYKVATGQWVHTREPVLAVSIAGALKPCEISDRNRIARVVGEGDVIWVYRIRARLDCRVRSEPSGVSMFVWDEIFHYSEFHGWTRNRFAAGSHIAVNKRWGFDLYYVHQTDEQTQPRDVNAVAITLQLRLGAVTEE